ncbi:MAG TPA: ABC transporter ATP-binding protein [Acidimicrobiales bacterium]|nr:ABC transporter ATP-binding protein [Acidimicrobiales bacterium]
MTDTRAPLGRDALAAETTGRANGHGPEPDRGTAVAGVRPGVPIVELRGVRACYGTIEVLHGVDLALAPGEVLAVLGPNGAGKTTMLSVLAGLHPLTGGDVMVAGRRVNGAHGEDLARVGVCLVPEGRGVFPNLTVRENLRMATYTGRRLGAIEAAAYDRFPRLGERRKQVAGTLSGGEQQMLALARALATDPAVLVLDELSMGLAPLVVEQLYQQVAALSRAGVSVLVVEQFAGVVLGVADRAAIMVHGAIADVGTPAEIEAKLSSAYLGG